MRMMVNAIIIIIDMHKYGLAQFHIETSSEVEGIQTAMGLLAHEDVYRTMSIFNSLQYPLSLFFLSLLFFFFPFSFFLFYCCFIWLLGTIEAPTGEQGTMQEVLHLIQRVFKKKTVALMMKELQKIVDEPETLNVWLYYYCYYYFLWMIIIICLFCCNVVFLITIINY